MTARYVAGRIGQAVVVLWAAYTVTFVVLYLLPSDPVSILVDTAGGAKGAASAAQVAAIKAEYGFDRPVPVQYVTMLGAALTGDLGRSVSLGTPVSTLLEENLPSTLALAVVAIAITVVAGLVLAFVATYVRRPWLRTLLERVPALGVSFPTFFIGLLLLQVFSFNLRLFPATGSQGLSSLALPAVTMAIPAAGMLAQVLVRGLSDTLGEAYVTTAHAKGLHRLVVHGKHALRNAALPALTILGVLVGSAVTASIVAETIFSRAGLGRLTQQAVLAQDIPLVMGIVVVAAAAFVLVNLVVDLIYPLLDPRVVVSRLAVRAA
ncbi:peptide/nickel transport system permease protein [Quadrisphaera granulorum]|uniref:Peptide/nickel transport system permease protein n=1 Tax=Quadrisphaera granulorum TaxID=317664 RepID=A0A315ZRY3_9ACTN|nr:ABC transporter permease [Quadrisphaera granulorum]PWJ48306.1 peptide/nickel transport system permease protein [Quadrisphaera granulorum]SZE98467.1 peptide/nickel transport system permease protein [Quadrisphaera granulorum]